MFSMCSELTPRARIPDTRIPQLMQPCTWLSATEGDKDKKLARLDHWPETEIVDNEIKSLESVETSKFIM